MNAKLLPGRIGISRPRPGNYISIVIVDKSSGIEFIEIRVEYAAFAQVLTGLWENCKFSTRGLELVGMRREHKTEVVFVPRCSNLPRKETAMEAIAAYETDEWTGRVSDALNHDKKIEGTHTGIGAKYIVTFIRYVDDEQCPQK